MSTHIATITVVIQSEQPEMVAGLAAQAACAVPGIRRCAWSIKTLAELADIDALNQRIGHDPDPTLVALGCIEKIR